MKHFALAAALCSLAWPQALPAQDTSGTAAPTAAKKADDDKKKELTLENLFPKDGLFGSSARSAAFSKTGNYAAWLHRPHAERRHGSDIYLMDAKTGKVSRVTTPDVLAPFQSRARDVVEHREKTGKKLKDGDKPTASKREGAKHMHLDARVSKKDAKDEKSPRYSGISSFVWAPAKDEMLFSSGGDIYHMNAADGAVKRLTFTKEFESSAQWLPDGSGFTYMRDNSLMRVRFGSHVIEEISPRLPGGEELQSYRLSPDGKRAVFVAQKGQSIRAGDRKVKIARYRDRFMEVREVPRHVSDDPIGKGERIFYLCSLEELLHEKGALHKIHTFKNTGPRDIVRTPHWSPDSKRVAFSAFVQEGSQVHVLEAVFPKPEAKDTEDEGSEKKDADDAEKSGEKPKQDKKTDVGDVVDHPAKVVYRMLHDGGPNTPRMIEPWYLADSRHVVLLTEISGFRHLHLLDPRYQSVRQLTSGYFEVYPFSISEDRKRVYALSTKEHASRQDIYSIDTESGEMTKLSTATGFYDSAAVSDDGKHVVTTFAAYGKPRELVHVDVTAARQRALTDSHPERAYYFSDAAPEFFEFENRHGQVIHGHMFKPKGFAKTDKRPLLIYVYGGPLGTRKQVVQGSFSSDSYLFARYMAEHHGWVTCTIDPRGMSGYGAAFEKANFEQVGKPQVEDLTDGVKHLIKAGGIDADKVAIHGWSFGGFQTQMCLYTEPDVFKIGMAGAGPTEWENYNSWYSTGTIGPSREGFTDLAKYSLLPLAKNLKGKLLLVHGMEDANVLYQDTVRVYRELLKAGKETLVELFVDPTGGHGLGGDVKRINRARKYEDFLIRNFGSLSK